MKIILAFIFFTVPCFAAINVSSVATSGTGTAASPWTGWDTAIIWVGEQQYNFPSGVYSYADSPNFLKTGIALIGEAGTVLKHTGSGNAVVFDNPGGQSPNYLNWTQNIRMENFIIQGNAATTNGLFLRGIRNGIFRHISVRDVSNAGIWTEACVTNILDNFRVTHHEMPNDVFNIVPAYGIVFSARGSDTSTTWTVTNAVIEGVSLIGIWAKNGCSGNTFINGTSEGNLGKGMVIDSPRNTIINMWFEVNGSNNLELNNPRNVVISSTSYQKPMTMNTSNSSLNQIIGGEFDSINVAGVNNVIQTAWVANLQDTGANTYKFALITGPVGSTAAQHYSKLGHYIPWLYGLSIVSGVVSTNALQASMFAITANQNFLLDNPTNPSNGQKITWRIWQTNNAQITYGSKFRPPPANSLPQLALPSGIYYISAIYNSMLDTWDVQ